MYVLPLVISSSVMRRPTLRCRKLYAPMPGNRLNSTSGKPMRAESSAITTVLASAASKPPPSALPCTSEIVVIGRSKLRFHGYRSSTHILA